jgi:RNA polymerase sigma factor (sigma-70 family)
VVFLEGRQDGEGVVGVRELELSVRIKNNRLLERREALRLSQDVMADVVGIGRQVYADLENLRLPAARGGEWTPAAQLVAEYFDCDPAELFPESLDLVRELATDRKLDASEVVPMVLSAHSERLALPPQELVDQRELGGRVAEAMRALSPRQREVVRMKYGLDGGEPLTYKQIGEAEGRESGTSIENIRQIHEQAVGKLRRVSVLYDVLDGAPLPRKHEWVTGHEAHERRRATLVELLEARPRLLRALRSVRDAAVSMMPGGVEMRPWLSREGDKVNLEVFTDGRSPELARYLQGDAEGFNAGIRATLHECAFDRVGRPGSRACLVGEARHAGFNVVERRGSGKNVLLSFKSDQPDHRGEILLMRLWFCDRADLVSAGEEGALWRPVDPRKKARRKP